MAATKTVAAAWLRREDWARWRAIDPMLDQEYEGWRAKFEAKIKELEQAGARVEKIEVGLDAFLAWSREHQGGAVNTKARALYAALILQNRQRH
jgi:hypothetical protein